MVNASLVLDALRQCAARGIPFAVVMTSGFSEAGEEGQRLEREIAELCEATGLHVYGPNCPGFVNVRDRLGMTFSPAFKDDLNTGSIGLATQGADSAATCCKACPTARAWACGFPPATRSTWRFLTSLPTWRTIRKPA